MPQTIGQMKNKAQHSAHVARLIENGLAGDKFLWDGDQLKMNRPIAKRMRFTLVSHREAVAKGYELNPSAESIGHAYFPEPVGESLAVYVLECHCEKVKKP